MWVEEWRGERGRGRPGRYRGLTTSIEIPQMAAVRFAVGVAAAWGRTGGTQQGKRGVAAHLLLSWLVFTRDVGQIPLRVVSDVSSRARVRGTRLYD